MRSVFRCRRTAGWNARTWDNPGIRYLANAALALGVELDLLIEDEWREWMAFDEQRHKPPEAEEFWRRPFAPGQTHLDHLRKQGRLR
jgi:hypothetical protein